MHLVDGLCNSKLCKCFNSETLLLSEKLENAEPAKDIWILCGYSNTVIENQFRYIVKALCLTKTKLICASYAEHMIITRDARWPVRYWRK